MVEPRTVYRFARIGNADDPDLENEFLSDREAGKRPFSREKAVPELRDGMSTFGSLEAARERWHEMSEIAAARGQPVRAGNFILEVELTPGSGFLLEDLGEPDEHLTIWGDKTRLAQAVTRVYAAATEGELG